MRPPESFVGQPIRSLQTMLRTISEYNDSVPTIVPDGIYGGSTRASVLAFQQNNGLPATGIVDQQTWERISEEYDEAVIYIEKAAPLEIIIDSNKVYVLGDRSPNLYIIQAVLDYLSTQHTSISAPSRNGLLDEKTAKSIASFQALNGLPGTGNIDRKTWKNLSKQYALSANRRENI